MMDSIRWSFLRVMSISKTTPELFQSALNFD